MSESGHEVTRILQRIADGDPAANNELLEIVYAKLHALARAHFRGPNDGPQTLQPTALVHEAYVKLFGEKSPSFANSDHLMAVAASAMRTILVDRARARATAKRGQNPVRVPLDSILVPYEDEGISVIDLDDALKRLALVSQQASRIVEMRFFGGLEMKGIARVLGVSVKEVERDWRTARAWLRRELSPDAGPRP